MNMNTPWKVLVIVALVLGLSDFAFGQENWKPKIQGFFVGESFVDWYAHMILKFGGPPQKEKLDVAAAAKGELAIVDAGTMAFWFEHRVLIKVDEVFDSYDVAVASVTARYGHPKEEGFDGTVLWEKKGNSCSRGGFAKWPFKNGRIIVQEDVSRDQSGVHYETDEELSGPDGGE